MELGIFFFSRSDSFVVAATSRAVDVRPGAPTEDGESCSVCYARPATHSALPAVQPRDELRAVYAEVNQINPRARSLPCPAGRAVPTRRASPS